MDKLTMMTAMPQTNVVPSRDKLPSTRPTLNTTDSKGSLEGSKHPETDFGVMMQMAAAMHSSGAPSSQVGISEGARQLAVESQALASEAGSAGADSAQKSNGLQDGSAQAQGSLTSLSSQLVY